MKFAQIRAGLHALAVETYRGEAERVNEAIVPNLPYHAAYRLTETAVEVFAVIHITRECFVGQMWTYPDYSVAYELV